MAKNEEEYDFGFTFADEDEIVADTKSVLNLQDQVEDLKSRLHDLNKIFKPLLENLAKNPDKPMIKWPNRKEIIEKQLKRLEALTKV
jgi:hypothetical protein